MIKTAEALWEKAARDLMEYVTTHVRAVGFKEINAATKAKESFYLAETTSKLLDSIHTPYDERPLLGGVQKLYRFDNGYGASVVRHDGSYGHTEGLWELAVTHEDELCYETSITDDVLGWLTDEQVEETLSEIARLPKKPNNV